MVYRPKAKHEEVPATPATVVEASTKSVEIAAATTTVEANDEDAEAEELLRKAVDAPNSHHHEESQGNTPAKQEVVEQQPPKHVAGFNVAAPMTAQQQTPIQQQQ